ncbi:MAG TPA: GNAT family N-acetyltransferase [Chryseolinea sp.]|nr:GNAT family N-acetyltransferase [Chryseolinea sp.]HPM30085.1 GNAT family N-acetyltransferase [Chryseolinea sp.]
MTEIKSAKTEDLEKIAACHVAAFPASLSSALGQKYVMKMLGWYLSSENTFLFYIESEGQCLGYCGVMIKKTWGVGSASSMAQFSFDQALRSFIVRPWLVLHAELRAKYVFIGRNLWTRLKRLVNRNQKNTSTNSTIFEPYVALVVIGVKPDEHGKGYGSLLLQEFEKRTVELGYTKMLLSVLTDNSKAIKSYKRNGWVITLVNGKSTSMEKRLHSL